MTERKIITKKQYFEAIKTIVTGGGIADISVDQMVAFIDAQVAQLDAKAEKAKLRAADKKAEGDALRAAVLAAITEKWQTGEEVTAATEGEEVTKSKVVARLTQLVASGEVVKAQLKDESGRKAMCYRLASAGGIETDEVESEE